MLCTYADGPMAGKTFKMRPGNLHCMGPLQPCPCGCGQWITYHYKRKSSRHKALKFLGIRVPEKGSSGCPGEFGIRIPCPDFTNFRQYKILNKETA